MGASDGRYASEADISLRRNIGRFGPMATKVRCSEADYRFTRAGLSVATEMPSPGSYQSLFMYLQSPSSTQKRSACLLHSRSAASGVPLQTPRGIFWLIVRTAVASGLQCMRYNLGRLAQRAVS
jgi:hypothetical protein